MRPVIVAANWKMHTTPADAADLAATMAARTQVAGPVERVICPPYVCLPAVAAALLGSGVAVGAQNIHHELAGAYTGEISAPMLVGLASWVILGHSERRRDAGETDALVGRKLRRAAETGLRPIVCVGERLEEREAGRAEGSSLPRSGRSWPSLRRIAPRSRTVDSLWLMSRSGQLAPAGRRAARTPR